MPDTLQSLMNAVIDGDQARTVELVRKSLEEGVGPLDVFRRGLIPGMEDVGRKMQSGEYFLPEVLISARAMRAASAVLKPMLTGGNAMKPIGKVVLGTVSDDLHDIGKNLVIMLLEGAGFQVVDLGVDVSPERFVAAVRDEKPDVLGLSALLSITMLNMKGVIKALDEAGCRRSVKVMVGGAIVSDQFAREAGADGYAPDAAGAVGLAKRLTQGERSR